MRFVVGGFALASMVCVGLAAAQTPPFVPGADLESTNGSTSIPVNPPNKTEVLGAENVGTSAGAAPMALEAPIDPDTYICGPGDVFELNFWGAQNFRLRIAADVEGRVFISKVGFVAVTGKSLKAVRTQVNKRVRSYYPGLSFELTLVNPRSFLVHVVENVGRPGAYTANPLERVSSVLARAGGAKGSRRRVTIRRKGGAEVSADLLLYELTGDTRYNPYVLDGDVIRVPFAEVVVSIAGAVRRPGRYELVKTKDLAELIELAGGLQSSVVKSMPIRIVRRNEKQQESFIDVPFVGTATPNHELRDDDNVIVHTSAQVQRSILLIGAVAGADTLDAATTSRRLPYVEGDTVRSLLERAGGIKSAGDLSRSYISRAGGRGAPTFIPVDLEALLVKRDLSADRPIEMGDTLVIPPMQHSIRVEGAVARSGLYPFNPRFGIAEYIAHAGGRTRTARDLDEVKLIDSNGVSRPYRSGLKPSPGDAILVPERTFTRPEMVQIAISVAGLVLSGVAITLAATR